MTIVNFVGGPLNIAKESTQDMEGKTEKVDGAVDVLSESNPSAISPMLPSGLPNAPHDAPWVTREDPILSIPQLSENRQETNTDRPGSIAHSNFMPVTNYIYKTERCSRYREMDLLDPTWTKYNRYRVVIVVRNDALAEYIEKIGPSNQVPGGPVNIIGGEGAVIVETYETMVAMAEEFREQLWPHQKYNMDPLTRNMGEFKELLARKVI